MVICNGLSQGEREHGVIWHYELLRSVIPIILLILLMKWSKMRWKCQLCSIMVNEKISIPGKKNGMNLFNTLLKIIKKVLLPKKSCCR